ncbi:helix-turn-helix domain-containing protein [Pseudomonas lactis]|uniref:helix-turn-helix domain-containing protein n=1 Tax=Pseudomonas lactis TaxID=1615674 RepID=UPI00067D49E1|nr:helix-turn-helix transcriptional regulator [Pseudomonas lactis]
MTDEFAANLVYLRGLKNLTQQELGDAIGVSPSQISRYESGSARPRKTVMAKLASVLGVTIEELDRPMPRHFPDTTPRDDDVELLFEVTFKKLGPVRCSLHFTREQHKSLAESYTSLNQDARTSLLKDFMIKAMVGAADTDEKLLQLGDKTDSITNASARFFAPVEYLEEIRGTPWHDIFVSPAEKTKS